MAMLNNQMVYIHAVYAGTCWFIDTYSVEWGIKLMIFVPLIGPRWATGSRLFSSSAKAQLRCSWTSAGRWGRRAWPRSSRAPPKRSWAPASRWAAQWMARSPGPCNRPSMKTSGSCPLSEPNLDKFKSRRFAEKNAESVFGEGYPLVN